MKPFYFLTTLLFAFPLVNAQYAAVSSMSNGGGCSATVKCPASAPCCSEFGFCGTGQFCLGGCNPLWSSSPNACIPAPICQSGNYTFGGANIAKMVNSTKFNGDATAADWTIDSGSALVTSNDELVLTLTQTGPEATGTRISSTREVLYGNLVARMKTSQYAGVVATFITMSGVRDEIDWEFPGLTGATVGQSNYYYEGYTANYTHGGTANLTNNAHDNYHNYGLNWQPNQLQWSVDGNVVRTLTRASTLDPATGVYNYPSTPARVQLSIWPAGIAAQPIGTQTWAGGLINWNTTDYTTTGYYYALIQSVSIDCTPATATGTSYVYGPNVTTGGPSVSISNSSTQIYSQLATGLDMNAGKTSASASNATFGLINAARPSFGLVSQESLIMVVSSMVLGLLVLV